MNILALDTSMGACSAALLAVDGAARTLVLREALMARGHAEALMPMVAEVMQESGTAFASLDLIAATVGPGSFTGVRIAIAAARGLALVDSRRTVRHRQPLGDGAQRTRERRSRRGALCRRGRCQARHALSRPV